jgi:hypothetical protein
MPSESLKDYQKRCELLGLNIDASDEDIHRAFEEKVADADTGTKTKLRFAKDYLLKHDRPDE